MKIIVAQTAGFCMGVKRAVDLAIDSAPKYPDGILTLGPVIHNNQTVEQLRTRGIVPIETSNRPLHPSTVLVRAHGVPPETERDYRILGHTLIDGTCPKVKTVHKVITRYREMGFSIIITGDQGHAEVIGLLGYAQDKGILIQTPRDVDGLPELEKICLVSQTTFDSGLFDVIAARVREHFAGRDVVIRKTICSATDKRQEETKHLATIVDAMIVVGGRNSANTMRLAQLSAAAGTPTQHVETEDEIDLDRLAGCETIGITAGASTPHWVIRRVVEYIQYMHSKKRTTARTVTWRFLDALANLNVFIALGAAAAYYASCKLQRIAPAAALFYAGAAISFLYFLSMYLWNSLASTQKTQHLGIGRHSFYSKHRRGLFAIAATSIAVILVLSARINSVLFSLMVFSTVIGCLYHITIVPPFLRKFFRYGNLKDIPTSRDLFVALAWGVLTTFIPHALGGSLVPTRLSVFFFFWIFALAYLRSVVLDLRDIEGDRIMGRETLVTIIGERTARRLIRVGLMSACVLIAVYSSMAYYAGSRSFSAGQIAYLFQTPVLVYSFLFSRWSNGMRLGRSPFFSLLADGQFFLTGLCAWLAGVLVGG